ncbi:MAG: helix-turn-helix domain-containing protein [Planctomycetes bacterium]|nr:helix-turn-helix domain-containing protein [Planctomycetota bacterium]
MAVDEIKISPSGLMDLENAARYLGCQAGTLRWLRRMHKLPFVKLGAKLMVKKADLDAYIEEITEPAI